MSKNVLIFATHPANAELRASQKQALRQSLRDKHAGAVVAVAPVKNATAEQLLELLHARQPIVVYLASCTDAGALRLDEVPPGQPAAADSPPGVAPDAVQLMEIVAAVQRQLAAPNPGDPDGAPSRVSMRRVLGLCFPKIESFDSFVEKEFPSVFHRYSSQMDRTSKTNLLLTMCDTSEMFQRLRLFPEFAPHHHELRFELYAQKLYA
jgi:hypothetical protein